MLEQSGELLTYFVRGGEDVGRERHAGAMEDGGGGLLPVGVGYVRRGLVLVKDAAQILLNRFVTPLNVEADHVLLGAVDDCRGVVLSGDEEDVRVQELLVGDFESYA